MDGNVQALMVFPLLLLLPTLSLVIVFETSRYPSASSWSASLLWDTPKLQSVPRDCLLNPLVIGPSLWQSGLAKQPPTDCWDSIFTISKSNLSLSSPGCFLVRNWEVSELPEGFPDLGAVVAYISLPFPLARKGGRFLLSIASFFLWLQLPWRVQCLFPSYLWERTGNLPQVVCLLLQVKSSDLNLLHERSTVSSILDHLVWKYICSDSNLFVIIHCLQK